MNERIRLMERALIMSHEEEIEHPGIEPLDVGIDNIRSVADVLERFYSMGKATYPLPVVKRVPAGYEQFELKTISGSTVTAYRSPDGEEMILSNPANGKFVRYRAHRRINAEETPVLDAFYMTRITAGEWYYYIPAGQEFVDFEAGREIVTNTQFAVDWENGTILDYPYGSMVGPGDDVFRNRNKLRAAVLAGIVNPKLFRETAKKYFSGKVDENDIQKIIEAASKDVVIENKYSEMRRPTVLGVVMLPVFPFFVFADP